MNILKKNLLVIIAIIVLIISGILYIYFSNQEQKEIESGFVQGKIAYEEIRDYIDGIMLAKKDNNYLIIDLNDKVIEKIDENADNIKILYGGYYTYSLDNKIYLNRNGKNVKTFDTLFLEEFNLYKDENDENSKYITLNANKLSKDIYYVTISNDDSISTVVYNAKTGKKLYETDNYISLLETPEKNIEYFIVGDKELVRIKDFKTIFKENDVLIVGDTAKIDVLENIKTNNSKYIVVSNNVNEEENKRYGLIDFDGNIVVPISYEDLFFKVNVSKYIVAKKDGKYGLINAMNEELLEFNYDALEVYDNNIIAVKDNRLGIMDNSLKNVYKFKLLIQEKAYSSRLCCGNENSFKVFTDENNTIITTYLDDEEGQNINNTLILDRKNEITELKNQNLQYIFDDKEIIKSKYLMEELIEDKTLTLNIYATSGDQLATYETLASDTINSVSYELINEEILLVTIYDNEYQVLYKALIDPTTGKVLSENSEVNNYVKKQNLVDGYYFYKEDKNIIIKNADDKLIANIDGEDIVYLNGQYFAVKIKGKYYICKIILAEEQVK